MMTAATMWTLTILIVMPSDRDSLSTVTGFQSLPACVAAVERYVPRAEQVSLARLGGFVLWTCGEGSPPLLRRAELELTSQ